MKKQKEKKSKKRLKRNGEVIKNNNYGITLIALVITIIVLLILAGISISMLSGDNGILQKAKDAKTFSERESVVEQARTDVLGYQTENQGGDLDKSQLKSVLDKYFDEVPDLTDMEKDAILNRELHTLSKYGTHTIAVYEIYNGDFLNTKSNKKLVDLITESTMYGYRVINYNANGISNQNCHMVCLNQKHF